MSASTPGRRPRRRSRPRTNSASTSSRNCPTGALTAAAQRDALMPEAERILKIYGNHPSFVMMALGNECGGSREVMADMVKQLRQRDNRRLYAQGSNNYFWDPQLAEGDDYWTTVRTRTAKGGPVHNVRGSFATVDGGNGHVQIGPPNTLHDYSAGIAGLPVPVIGHEVGQYTVYPNFREIPKYTGVFRARNFEHWRDKLAAAGMLDQADDFFRASGKLAALCYREDIEAALRTPGFGGFQLLDLQDFPGQGTALVGMLDAFMDTKGLITARRMAAILRPDGAAGAVSEIQLDGRRDLQRRRSNWRTMATKDLGDAVVAWTLEDPGGRRVAAGQLRPVGSSRAACATSASVSAALGRHPEANAAGLQTVPRRPGGGDALSALGLSAARGHEDRQRACIWRGSSARRNWSCSPRGAGSCSSPKPSRRCCDSVAGGFATDFWCWPMFKNTPGTMGILCDPKHPALAGFPTEFHSDWQWFHIVTNSRPVILDGSAKELRPIVQVVDNLDRVHKLGLIFEAKVGAGPVAGVRQRSAFAADSIGASHLLGSLYDYAGSAQFNPTVELTPEACARFAGSGRALERQSHRVIEPVRDVRPRQGRRWRRRHALVRSTDAVDQWWQVDLDEPQDLTGCELNWEFDRAGYRYVLEGSADGATWGTLERPAGERLPRAASAEFHGQGDPSAARARDRITRPSVGEHSRGAAIGTVRYHKIE